MSANEVKFGNKKYLMVEARLAAMVKDHKGKYSLVISPEFEGDRVTATCKLSIGDQVFMDSATEYGTERKTQEKASTHALGRALSMAGYAGSEYGMEAPIASANEMQDFIREENNSINQLANSWELERMEILGFGKHKAISWEFVDYDYLEWLSGQEGGNQLNKERATLEIEYRADMQEIDDGLEK